MAHSEASIQRGTFLRSLLHRNPDIEIEEVLKEWDKAKKPKNFAPDAQMLSQARFALKNKYGILDVKSLPRHPNGSPDVKSLIRRLAEKSPKASEQQICNWITSDGLHCTNAMVKTVREEAKQPAKPLAPLPAPEPAKAAPVQPVKVGTNGTGHLPSATVAVAEPINRITPVMATAGEGGEGQGQSDPGKLKNATDAHSEEQTESPDPKQETGRRARHVGKPGRKSKNNNGDGKGTTPMQEIEKEQAQQYLDMEDKLDDLINTARTVQDAELVQRLKEARRHTIVTASKLAT
jgi:hypothetical protein